MMMQLLYDDSAIVNFLTRIYRQILKQVSVTVQLDLNLMLASTVPTFKIVRIACAQP